MDLDLAQVRAFVATAEQLHFGRAAGEVVISQQALSKRIARLESALGVRLFVRGQRTVGLTEAGQRFLEPARQTLRAADAAVAAARDDQRPLRIDVWGHLYGPMRTIRAVLEYLPGLPVELGASRDLPAAVGSLERGEIDVGFGRVHPLDPAGPRLAHRLVRLEPLDAIVGAGHPLARAADARPADLGTSVLWCPADLGRLDYLRRFADQFGTPTEAGTANLGLDHLLDQVRSDPRYVCLLPAEVLLTDDPSIRSVPLVEPTPLYGWSLLWRGTDHQLVDALLRGFAEVAARRRWLEYAPDRDWLPDVDRPGV